MALTLLATNNASSVLAAGISATATTLSVNTGTGASFPVPVSGTSYFKLTLVDSATGSLTEIVHVTAVSGDNFTVVRGQEGTTARAWSANDIAANMFTAGTLAALLQINNNLSEIASAGSAAQLAARNNLGLTSLLTGRLLNVQVFTAAGTYTPTSGTNKVIVEAVGGGASGGNCATTSGTTFGCASGGGSGSYAMALISNVPNSAPVTIGAGGAAAAAGANAGSAGGQTTFGSLLTCPGGINPAAGVVGTTQVISTPSITANPPSSTGLLLKSVPGAGGGYGISLNTTQNSGGNGGSNPLGTGGWSGVSGGSRAAFGYGSGSSGASSNINTTATVGQPGMPGFLMVWEYA